MSAALDLTDVAPARAKPRTPIPDHAKAIIRAVAEEAGLDPSELFGPSRKTRTCWPRFIAMYRLSLERKPNGKRRDTPAAIGRMFGRDHSTVIYACGRVESGEIIMRPVSREAEEFARKAARQATQNTPPSTGPHLPVDGAKVAVLNVDPA